MNLKLISIQLTVAVALVLPPVALAEPDGLESHTSAKDYAQTVVALRETLNDSKAKIFQEIDHRSNALGSDVDLPPSHVFIFGNPEVGSRLMQCVPLLAADLPMRMLVKGDGKDNVKLYWTNASTLMKRYSSSLTGDCRELAAKVDDTLAGLARKAAAKEK